MAHDADTVPENHDVLRPWGPAGPPPPRRWSPDVLGAGYSAQTLPLLPDEEGPAVATLVKYTPPKQLLPPRAQCLYIHGRNDYFFQTELAEHFAAQGVQFFALDLRKHGRSLRPWQTIGAATDMSIYDEEIGIAMDVLHREGSDLPLFLMGHSTGGLIATVWAYRHPGAASGLILNAGWLELQAMASWRPALQQVMNRIAQINPNAVVIANKHPDKYGPSLTLGWSGSGLPLPKRLDGYKDDPAVAGWPIFPQWRHSPSYPVTAGWMRAIMEAQDIVAREVHLDCPVLSICSTGSASAEEWSPAIFSNDIVLDADIIVERSAHLADVVTIARLPGKHDMTLSDPDVRAKMYQVLQAWLRGVLGTL